MEELAHTTRGGARLQGPVEDLVPSGEPRSRGRRRPPLRISLAGPATAPAPAGMAPAMEDGGGEEGV
jgi:hypothetical protein